MDFLSTLAEFVIGLLGKKPVAEVKVQIPFDGPVVEEALKSDPLPEVGVPPYIDWTNGSAMVSKHFTVKETCWLPSWKVMHIPSEIEKQNILKQAAKMDLIRDFLNVPINIHCWIRPILNNPESEHNGEDYNALVKGATNSAHKIGLATDYDASGLNCDDVRSRLEGKLEEWQIRMEKMPGGNWVHNDCAPVIAYRYFNP